MNYYEDVQKTEVNGFRHFNVQEIVRGKLFQLVYAA